MFLAIFRTSLHRLLAATLVCFLAGCAPDSRPTAFDGFLDLSEADLSNPIDLAGQWRALSGDDESYSDYHFDDSQWDKVSVPGMFADQGLPNEGIVWYRLRLQLPEAAELSAAIESAGNAHEIYASTVSGETTLLASSGSISTDLTKVVRSRKSVTFAIPPATDIVLSWRVANVDYAVGGPYYAVRLGTTLALTAYNSVQDRVEFALFWAYLIIGFFFLINWVGSRSDVQSLSVSLLSFGMMTRTAAISGQLEYLFPLMDFRTRILLEGGSFFMIILAFPFVLWTFFPTEFSSIRIGKFVVRPGSVNSLFASAGIKDRKALIPRWLRIANTSVLFVASLYGAIVLIMMWFVSTELMSHTIGVARYFSLVLIVAGLSIVVLAFERGRPMAASVLLSILFVFGGFANDIFSSMGVIGTPEVSSYTFMVFLLSLSFVVARRNRRHVDQLHATMYAAEQANLAKSQFITSISHELRTPLTIVMGYSQVLDSELNDKLEGHHLAFLREIRESGSRLLMLVNDLLDLAQVETGNLDVNIADVEASKIILETAQQMIPLIEGKEVELTVEGADVPIWIRADKDRYAQVVLNLMSNAAKFTQQGHIRVSLTNATLKGLPAMRLEVADTGMGISEEFVTRVFDRFTQEKRAYDSTLRGTGIGLALSKEMVERMAGEIGVESQTDTGSTFWVTIPAAPHRNGRPDREAKNNERGPIARESSGDSTAVGQRV